MEADGRLPQAGLGAGVHRGGGSYSVQADGAGFKVTGSCDVDGDGQRATFEATHEVEAHATSPAGVCWASAPPAPVPVPRPAGRAIAIGLGSSLGDRTTAP
ncbi:MAG: hypothetical protein R2724_34735 [Bryobacterales bacterium]